MLSDAAGYGEPNAASGVVAVLVSHADRASREYSERLREQAERSTLAHTRAVRWLSVVITIATVVQAYAALVK